MLNIYILVKSTTDNMDANDNNEHVHILEEYCASDDISLDGLKDKLNQIIQPTALACSHFLHELCLNQNVTLDMVQLVLENNPYAAHCESNRYNEEYMNEDVDVYEEDQNGDTSYPVHLAALNIHCPNTVVELLAKSYPSALSHLCYLDAELFDDYDNYIAGTPIHYYFARTSNLQLDTVKTLVELCPDALMLTGAEESYFPIHSIIDNPTIGSHHDIIQYLVSVDPTILQCENEFEQLPLHLICYSRHVTVELVQVVLDGYADATKEPDYHSSLPIHNLCGNVEMKEKEKLDILRILIDIYPESLHTSRNISQVLPIHIACRYQGPDFCKLLVDSYPDSLRLEESTGFLPFHLACDKGSIETVKYLYEAYQECINKSTRSGLYPIHVAISNRSDDQYEITKFLLQCDPDCAATKLPTGSGYAGYLPLHLAVVRFASLEAVKLLFDAYPPAIYVKEASSRGGVTPVNLINVRNTTVDFLQRQEDHISRFSKNDIAFPLHMAVKNNVTLGVFKYLVQRLPISRRTEHRQDNEGKTALHLACEYGTFGIIKYLAQHGGCLFDSDADGNYPLHLACREGHCDVINYLLEVNPVSVSTQNGDKKLPIELLIESDCDQDSLEYTEATWRLLVASPPTF